MECSFRVGQKVVCVMNEGAAPDGYFPLTPVTVPEVGTVYTVRQVSIGVVGRIPCVKLVEIPDQLVDVLVGNVIKQGDVVFHAFIFRPVVDRGTEKGMSILRDLLNKQSQPARVEA